MSLNFGKNCNYLIDIIGIHKCIGYSLRQPPAFSYNALGYLKDPNTVYFSKQKQSPFRQT